MKEILRTKYAAAVMLLAAVLLVGCRSSKNAVKPTPDVSTSEYLSSRLELTIPYKEVVYTVGGTMKMKAGEMIQVSLLMPVFRAEVARVQVTPSELLIVDRMNRRFARAGESELRYAVQAGFTYGKLEQQLRKLAKESDDGHKTLSGADLGMTSLAKAKVEFIDFTTEPVDISPIDVSSRYKQVTLEEMLQLLSNFSK